MNQYDRTEMIAMTRKMIAPLQSIAPRISSARAGKGKNRGRTFHDKVIYGEKNASMCELLGEES
jgi:hypothetical protein